MYIKLLTFGDKVHMHVIMYEELVEVCWSVWNSSKQLNEFLPFSVTCFLVCSFLHGNYHVKNSFQPTHVLNEPRF